MRILQHTGETPRLQAQATEPGVLVGGSDLFIGETAISTQYSDAELSGKMQGREE